MENYNLNQKILKKKIEKLEEVIKNKPNLFEEEEEEGEEGIKSIVVDEKKGEKEIIICLKRKRDETPLEELFIETPKNKKRTMKDILSEFENLNFKNENLVHKFTLFQTTNEKEVESTKDLIENIKKRKNFKIIEKTNVEENKFKKKEKLIEKTKENRLIKINKSRQEDMNILKVQFEEKETFEPFLNLLEKYGEKFEIEKEDESNKFDYDYYYYTEKIKENYENLPNLMKFDETLTFEDEYYSNEDDSDIDSIDSNREDHPWNDYPEDEEVYTSDDEDEDEDIYDHHKDYYERNDEDFIWKSKEDDISLWDNRNGGDEYNDDDDEEEEFEEY